jgi:hypothetical protein
MSSLSVVTSTMALLPDWGPPAAVNMRSNLRRRRSERSLLVPTVRAATRRLADLAGSPNSTALRRNGGCADTGHQHDIHPMQFRSDTNELDT